MSAPEATGTRQRATKTENPASLSGDPNKKVPRNKPQVNPPFYKVSFGRFLTYLVLGLSLIAAFYGWRFTVWAAEVGGYWNLMTGHRNPPATGAGEAVMRAAASAASQRRSAKGSTKPGAAGGDSDIESQIIQLANSLGVKPADLSSAIRPLIDPTAPNPVEAAKLEAQKEILSAGGAASGAEANKETPSAGFLAAMGEVLLD